MPQEVEIDREVDPVTGQVTKTVTEQLGDAPGDVIITTTTYDKNGGIQMRVRETFHRPPEDPRARSNLVLRETFEYGEDGKTVSKLTTETFGGGVNEIPGTKTTQEWVIDPRVPGGRWLRFTRVYHWADPPGQWVQDATVEQDDTGKVIGVTHP